VQDMDQGRLLPSITKCVLRLLIKFSVNCQDLQTFTFVYQNEGWQCELQKPYTVPEGYRQKYIAV
jgi:hypothetical protein